MQIPLKHYGALLTDYLKPQQQQAIWLALTLLSSIGLQVLNPQLLGYFIDTAVNGGSTQTLWIVASGFIGIAILTQVLAVSATYFGETIAWAATNALRVDLAEHCLRLDLSFHKSRTPGELLERVDGDVTLLSRFFSQMVIHVLGNGILLAGILLVLFVENAIAGLSLTAFSLVAMTLLLGMRSFAVAPWTHYRQKSAEFFGFVGEQLSGREDICANGAVGYVMRRFHELLQHWLPLYQRARFASTVLWTTSVGLFTIGNAVALAVAAYLWNQQAITIGTAYLIFHYTNLLAQPIERIREELEEFQQVEASIYRIQELRSVQPTLKANGDQPLPTGALSITFEQVCFTYEPSHQQAVQLDTNWTLHNISFHLPAGQVLGLLGRTGSGKTTIGRLLLRLYDYQSGAIGLGDVPIQATPLSQLRQRVGLVTQDVQLFNTSIRHNLTFFNPTISDDQILQVLQQLELMEWLRSLPQGLDTQLGSDSSGLSAGQAQLLAFARIFLKNPGLVILDEASSRLDPLTERLIEQAIDRLLTGRTGIIIAHRLATVQRADQLLILDQGKIIEYGDRRTLADNPDSHFAQLLQQGTADWLA
ncbi:ABC transporter ATP-binding protein [Thermocoleostomius sinensis]|uniref:ABC transporter ATP-binding protein n=1 Tax=Thermocoleostomius sinensis A174 TaxID=2016057 RepID=A0A9E8ZE90_9CYAN|nr:ABC transporter ATP-binding protein [Thermocoleostomius sinensis]WAL59753.1 ABC transporter ATP-binding protein [Thermocoleostomius sinensis A174]